MNMAPIQKVKPKHRLSWVTVFFIVCAIVSYLAINGGVGIGSRNIYYATDAVARTPMVRTTSMVMPSEPSDIASMPQMQQMHGAEASRMDPMMPPNYYPTPSPIQNLSVTDTREFEKTYYEATMRSREVQTLTKRIETTVRGYAGRVDQTSSSALSGFVRFVVPAARFDEFRTELEKTCCLKSRISSNSKYTLKTL
jgi:hypothetical protein